MKIQKQYNFYDLSAVERDIAPIDTEHTIISTCSLQKIDETINNIASQDINKFMVNRYKINKDVYSVILFNDKILKPVIHLDWSRPEIQDLACAVWANDIYTDNVIYHTCSLEMYNYAQLFFGKDSIILH